MGVQNIAQIKMKIRIARDLQASIHIIHTDWEHQSSGLYTIIENVRHDLPITPGHRQILLISKNLEVQ